MSESDWRAVAERVRNWGRWGAEDELGTLNFITPQKIKNAATLVKKGRAIPLGIPVDANGPLGAYGFRRNPLHMMTVVGADSSIEPYLRDWGGNPEEQMGDLLQAGPMRFNDDFIVMHLQAGTQWDALSHIYYDDRIYNDTPASAVNTFGATKAGIEKVAQAGQIVTRGVLLDVAYQRGQPYLSPDTTLSPSDLEAAAKAAGLAIESGDVVCVRTGWWGNFLETGMGDTWRSQFPGLSWRCAEWLHDREVAAVACDNLAVEGHRQDIEIPNVFHMLALRDMGMMLGEMWNFEALSADCAADGVYEFQLVAQPLEITGAVGSPVNPLAIK